MTQLYPQYGFTQQDVNDVLVRYVQLDNPQSYPFDSYHSHEYSEMLYFEKGGGTHNINFIEYEIVDNSLHLLNGGDLHWLERSMDSKGFAIVYKDAFLYKLQEANGSVNYVDYFDSSAVVNFTEEEATSFSLLLHEIKNNSTNHLYIFNLIGAFFTKLVLERKTVDEHKKSFADGTIKQFYDLIQLHYAERLHAEDYARMLCISVATLERKVKEATGKTINALQQEYLLKEAKRLLIQTDLPLKEIADKLGFLELPHFSNWFKKLTHTQPGHYRK